MRLGARLGWFAILLTLLLAAPAQAGPTDPVFVFVPVPAPPPAAMKPPPTGYLNGPCGLAVDSASRFYVSDYYHRVVDVFEPNGGYTNPSSSGQGYVTQLAGLDPLNGPCGLGLDSTGRLYVNDFHRNVSRFGAVPLFGAGAVLAGAPLDALQPTGIAITPGTDRLYVDARTHIAVFDSTGAPVLDPGGEPLRIGEGVLSAGHGLAISRFSGTLGRLYVPDAATDTVKMFDSTSGAFVGSLSRPGGFVSLRDSAVAVDDVTGDVYVADNTQPQHTEQPQSAIYVFGATGTFKGHLKYNVADALPPGLAVDNTANPTQGRVYVTSGNTNRAGIYAYPPGAATTASALPPTVPLGIGTSGSGEGTVSSTGAGIACSSSCEAEVLSGERVLLTAVSGPGSVFAGWSGDACTGTVPCEVTVDRARSVTAEFLAQPGTGAAPAGSSGAASPFEVTQKGTLRVSVAGGLSPRRLPRTGVAPISVSVAGKISTTDASLPPQLKALRIELNRNGKLDYAGLPTCRYAGIQPASSERALAACRPALVGTGSFTAEIILSGQQPYPTTGRLLVFNGTRGGKPVLFGHIYAPRPFATSFVIVFSVQKLARGVYGTALHAPLPKAMDAWGRLTGLDMTLSRRYVQDGERHSYLSAGCPAPTGFPTATFPLARTSFLFEDGTQLASVLIENCRARG
jgi:hypothetical protein